MKIELVEGGKAPTRATDGSVGYDLYARSIVYDMKEDCYIAHMGFKVDLEIFKNFKYAGIILPRSGLGTKHRMTLLNTAGVIDTDYRGEVILKFTIRNFPEDIEEFMRGNGEQPRIAQMVVVPVYTGSVIVVDKLEDSERGVGGFGHTGVN